MTQSTPAIQFEDIPLAEARRMSRGPRMPPEPYRALKEKIESLDNTATRLTIPEGTSTATMKHRILQVAAELGIPVMVRKVPGGLLFWRSTDEDLPQATEVAHGVNRPDSHHTRPGAADANVDSAVRQCPALGALGR
jgi:hypothetical protein